MEVTVERTSSVSRSYNFDSPILKGQFDWLKKNQYIESYEISGGSTLTITYTDASEVDSTESDFVIPGLKRTFDNLSVKHFAHN